MWKSTGNQLKYETGNWGFFFCVYGSFSKLGLSFWGSHKKDCSILGSILGSPSHRNCNRGVADRLNKCLQREQPCQGSGFRLLVYRLFTQVHVYLHAEVYTYICKWLWANSIPPQSVPDPGINPQTEPEPMNLAPNSDSSKNRVLP